MSSSSSRPPRRRPSTSIWATATRSSPSYGHVRDLPEKDGSVLPDEDFKIIYEALARQEEARRRDRPGGQGRRQAPDPRHRPRPRGRGDLLAPAGAPEAAQGAQGRRRRAGGVPRGHQARRARGHAPRPQPRRASDRRLPGAPRAGLSRRLPALAGAVAQAAQVGLVGRPRAVGGPAPDLRARGRDPRLPGAGILDGRGAAGDARRAGRSRPGSTQLDGKRLDKFALARRGGGAPGGARDRGARRSPSTRSRRSRSAATRRRRSAPRPCSRRPRASWASRPTGR